MLLGLMLLGPHKAVARGAPGMGPGRHHGHSSGVGISSPGNAQKRPQSQVVQGTGSVAVTVPHSRSRKGKPWTGRPAPAP